MPDKILMVFFMHKREINCSANNSQIPFIFMCKNMCITGIGSSSNIDNIVMFVHICENAKKAQIENERCAVRSLLVHSY